ncbi:SIR2 family NAD-dependent protein deacylase [Chryseobacterium lathyri]|jgi:NAD-dependent SIR2 family protein deacetylase|uniref:Uncharacterized protein n=1 Tax=Chryseobacterium lathyri TaxID=395933 RepID=A0A511YF59_9FLAO|nr:SIR2 family protein [Chryseobacterium lathyri]GEN73835.1 hypothetical protein CLA01_39070 [Chryseobacterium lathyri]
MGKENLFQLISRGEVVLWIGAGLSLYAGLPSGNQLSQFLFDGLSKEEKDNINKNLLLPDLVEEIYRIKGNNRNYIIQRLKERILLKNFPSISTHEIIAKIPHFRDIITTNYDRLFEEAFKSSLNVIYSDQQIPYLDNKKINLFKIHGDLSVPDSVIITKSDYDNFFGNRKGDDVLWTVIKEKIATKNILFIGYNLEDSNIAVIFDGIAKKLGENRKECFFVSPKVPPQKLYHLSGKNIHYIDSTGEQLFSELIQYLKDNIKKDCENKLISTEIYAEFIRNFNLKSDIEINESKNIIKSFSGINNDPETKAKFTIKSDYPDFDKIIDLSKGEYLDELVIDKSAFSNWDFRIEGIKIADIDDIKNLTVIPMPSFDKKVDLVFENGIEINDVHIKIFRGGNKNKLLVEFYNNEFEILFYLKEDSSLNFKFDYKNSLEINSVSKQLQFYTAMNSFALGKIFNVYSEGNLIYTSKDRFESSILDGLKGLYEYNIFYYKYFNKLREIEQAFKIKFSNIDINDVSDENYSYLEKIIAKFKKEPIEQAFKGISFKVPLTQNNIELFEDSVDKIVPIKLEGHMGNVIVHNHEFELGNYEIRIIEPLIANVQNILQGANEKLKIESSKEKALFLFKE